jgi:hypothetical protein
VIAVADPGRVVSPSPLVLAVDPGPVESAWLVYGSGRIGIHGKCTNEDLLDGIRNSRFDDCKHMAIEMIASYGMAVGKEVFETVLWLGRFAEAWDATGGCWSKVYRRDVKLHICGSARATDSNIRTALIDRFGAPGTKKSPGATFGISKDVWAALAIAVTWTETKGGG